jgi:hypothetical protein
MSFRPFQRSRYIVTQASRQYVVGRRFLRTFTESPARPRRLRAHVAWMPYGCGSSGVSCRPAGAGPAPAATPRAPLPSRRPFPPRRPLPPHAAASARAPQPPRCDIDAAITASMSHRGGPAQAAAPPGRTGRQSTRAPRRAPASRRAQAPSRRPGRRAGNMRQANQRLSLFSSTIFSPARNFFTRPARAGFCGRFPSPYLSDLSLTSATFLSE